MSGNNERNCRITLENFKILLDKVIQEKILPELQNMHTKRLLNRQEAANYLGISLSKFDNIRGDIQAAMIGNSLLWRKEDLEAYIENNLIKPKINKTSYVKTRSKRAKLKR